MWNVLRFVYYGVVCVCTVYRCRCSSKEEQQGARRGVAVMRIVVVVVFGIQVNGLIKCLAESGRLLDRL
jgi:hypothetical protein